MSSSLRTLLGRASYGVTALALPCIVSAADVAGVEGLMRNGSPVQLPGVGRVVLSFLLVVVLGVGIVVALRRFQPQLSRHLPGATSIRVLDRAAVGGVRIYLLSVDGHKVLLTEHRNSTSLFALESAPSR